MDDKTRAPEILLRVIAATLKQTLIDPERFSAKVQKTLDGHINSRANWPDTYKVIDEELFPFFQERL